MLPVALRERSRTPPRSIGIRILAVTHLNGWDKLRRQKSMSTTTKAQHAAARGVGNPCKAAGQWRGRRDCLPRGWIGDGGHGSCAKSQFDTSKIPSCGVPTLIVDSSYCHRRGERLSVNFFPTHVFEEVWDKLRSQFPRGIVKDNLLPALMR